MKLVNNIIAILFFSVLIFSCTAQGQNALTAAEFQKEITTKQNIQVLDVRTPAEYFSGHIKNSMQADWNDKAEFARRLSFVDKNKPVYVYCLSGGRSGAAAAKMRSEGYKNVYELAGGLNAWRAASLPLEGSNNEKQMTIDEFNAGINTSKTVLVDFGATWCPPCKQMEPVLKSIGDKNNGTFTILKIDGGKDQDILKQYNVTALPVFIIFKDGKQVWRKDGVVTEKEITEHLN